MRVYSFSSSYCSCFRICFPQQQRGFGDPQRNRARSGGCACFGVHLRSTKLVIELDAVLWLLMGWQFVVTEIFGAFVLIALMWLLVTLFFPQTVECEIGPRVELKKT